MCLSHEAVPLIMFLICAAGIHLRHERFEESCDRLLQRFGDVFLVRIGKEQILQFLDVLFNIAAVLLHRIGLVAVGAVVLEPLGIMLLEISQFLSHFLEIVTAISPQLFDLLLKAGDLFHEEVAERFLS